MRSNDPFLVALQKSFHTLVDAVPVEVAETVCINSIDELARKLGRDPFVAYAHVGELLYKRASEKNEPA